MSEQDQLFTMVRKLRIPVRPDLSLRSLEDEEAWLSEEDLKVEEYLEVDIEEEEIGEEEEIDYIILPGARLSRHGKVNSSIY